MISQFLPRLRFSFRPEQNLRYFIVNYTLTSSFENKYGTFKMLKELANIQQEHYKYTQHYEDQGSLIFGAKKNKSQGMMYIFHTRDEKIPYDYIKQDPIFKEGLVIDYNLEEIELKSKGKSTELSQLLQFR